MVQWTKSTDLSLFTEGDAVSYQNFAKHTQRNQATRLHIAQTLLRLLAKEPLNTITTTKLIQESNVSRMTFYKYYGSKQDVLADYLYEIVTAYRMDLKQHPEVGNFHEFSHICHCLRFFANYQDLFRILIHANLHGLILETINEYMDLYVLPEGEYSQYELYYYAGAISNTYTKWITSGQKQSPEAIATILHRHLAAPIEKNNKSQE